MVALGARLVDRIGGGLISCSHGCPRGSTASSCPEAIGLMAVQNKSGNAAACNVTASL